MDDGRKVITIAHPEQSSGELKRPFMVIFLYNVCIFVWIQQSCLTNTVLALDPSNSVIMRLKCSFNFMKN